MSRSDRPIPDHTGRIVARDAGRALRLPRPEAAREFFDLATTLAITCEPGTTNELFDQWIDSLLHLGRRRRDSVEKFAAEHLKDAA
jgi:hypothetical protein